MQDASLPLEISRLYVDLADRIIARDEEGARRIYEELLRAGTRVASASISNGRSGVKQLIGYPARPFFIPRDNAIREVYIQA